MPFQLLSERAVALLRSGDQLLFGRKPENLAAVEVINMQREQNGPTRVRVRLQQDFDRGSSWWKAGTKTNAYVGELWALGLDD